jgi:Undecaprenyl-phosphate glucose phosphotransferase
MHNDEIVQREGSTSINESFSSIAPVMNIRQRIHEIENIAPITTFFKSFLDPVLVVITLYVLHFIFDVVFDGLHIVLAVTAFLLSMQFLDGTYLFLPGEKKIWLGVGRFAFSWLFVIFILVLVGTVSHLDCYYYPLYIITWFIVSPFLLILTHFITRKAIMPEGKRQSKIINTLIVGANQAGLSLKKSIQENSYLNMTFSGFFDDREIERLPGVDIKQILGRIEDIPEFVKQNHIDHIYISLPMTSQPRVMKLLDELQDSTVSVYFIPDFFVFDLIQAHFDHVAGVPVVCICESPFRGLRGVVKRFSDIIFASMILALIWPVMLIVALAVKLTSVGPVFFKQKRYGVDGKSINVYKFRSMTVMEDGNIIPQATQNDQRLTPIGGFLRKTSLDELPQFLNVLEGTMSIVGPRPHANAHNEYYRKLIKGYMVRHKVKPGITGWAQVNGFRGETETLDKMENRVNYDLDYLKYWSLWMDLKIIALTVALVLKRKNAY